MMLKDFLLNISWFLFISSNISSAASSHSAISRKAYIFTQDSRGFNVVPAYPVNNKKGTESRNDRVSYEQKNDNFLTRSDRQGFIRKVYSIFAAQMLTTIIVISTILSNYNLEFFLQRNFLLVSLICALSNCGIFLALVGSQTLRHKAPLNFILLGLSTLLQSIAVGTFSSLFELRTVCLGAAHTLAVLLAITFYSFQPSPKYDLTLKGNVLLTTAMSLFTGGILSWLFQIPLLDNIVSGGLAVLFAAYIAYDTQQIVGGKNYKYSYGKSEYILAALRLYESVINFFVRIMIILANIYGVKGERD